MAISDGMTVGWTSPMIPYFLSENSHLKMTRHEAESLETFLLIGAVIGLPFTIYCVDKIGRKKSLLMATASLLVAWIVVAFANSIELLYFARILAGMGGDMAFVAAPMYIAEIADQNIRGVLASIIYLMMLTGVMLIYIVGWFCPFYVPSIVAGVLLILQLSIFSFLPETPYFLLSKHKYEEAKASLAKFRGTDDIQKELTEISTAVQENNRPNEKFQIKDIFLMKNYRRSMMIMAVLNSGQQLCAINVILMNMHDILSAAGSIYMESSTTAIIFTALMLVAASTAAATIDRFGRKKLMICSCLLVGLCLLTIAIYFHIKNSGMEYKSISWIPLLSIMTYALVNKFGIGMVPIVITGEIFAPKFKAIGMTIADAIYVTVSIISIKIYTVLRDYSGLHTPFYIFSCCTFLVALFIVFFVPETKGKSLEEIQSILRGDKKTKNSPENDT